MSHENSDKIRVIILLSFVVFLLAITKIKIKLMTINLTCNINYTKN